MHYGVWLLRLGFAAWLVPAGLNHFYPLFPQPLGNQPESTALITALIETGLFSLVKAVELFAGLCLLFGWRVPLALLLELPISFNVWYWDVPLQGWGSVSAYYGWAVLLATLLLMAAYHKSYAAMLRPLATPHWPPRLAVKQQEGGGTARAWDFLRLVLGLAMALLALNYVLAIKLPFPVGSTPLAFELLEGLYVSRLIYVAMGLLLVAGLALMANRFVPLVLAAAMPVLVCMAYWAVVLERSPAWGLVALVLVALAGLLMLAHLPVYAGVLQPVPLAVGESEEARYERRYAWPLGRLAARDFVVALLPLAGAAAFYQVLLPPVLGRACLAVLLYPLAVLALRLVQGLVAKPQAAV